MYGRNNDTEWEMQTHKTEKEKIAAWKTCIDKKVSYSSEPELTQLFGMWLHSQQHQQPQQRQHQQ